MKSVFLTSLMALALGAQAQQTAYGQCGGIGWSGATTCVSGFTCVKGNDWYSQCLPGAASTTSTTSTTIRTSTIPVTTATTTPVTRTTTTSPPQPTGTSGTCTGVTKFKYYGVNQAGAEFGSHVIPGLLGTHYTWPTRSSVDWFVQRGFNTFRIGFQMERLSPLSSGLTGNFDQTYLRDLKDIVNYTTSKGVYAVVNPHNYMRYNGQVITDTAAFASWWTKLAAEFKDNQRVIFDVNNEPHTMSVDLTFDLQQAGVNGIRASGAKDQLILISGTAWTGAWSWISSGNSARIGDVKDPSNNLAVQMHQYLDADSSGTSPTCVSPTIGAERVREATEWCKAKGVKCFLGEIGAGSNDVCIAAVKSALCAMQQGGGVWVGALWWAAGPWWGDYFQSIEPPNGAAISRILPEALMPFM